MNLDPTLTRAADETAGRQPNEAGRPGEAAAAAQAPFVGTRRAIRRYELERSRRLAMLMLDHLTKGVDGKLFANAQESVDKLKDPFLAMNRMQRELRRIIAQEERLDEEDAARAERLAAEGAENAEDGIDPALVEARRAARRDDLDRSQQMTMAMLLHLAEGVTGLSAGAAQEAVDKLKDPFLAINRMQQELRRIIALAEQLDENDAERTKRLAAEAEAEEDAARRAERWHEGRAAREAEEAKKAAIRQAVTDAARDAWGDDTDLDDEDDNDDDDDDRESVKHLLDDLFDDYETYEDYDRDPVEIVAKMCAELGLKPAADSFDEPAPDDIDPAVVEQARTLELARGYLERAGWAVEPALVQDGQGPPDG
jgi:hypothetical protein